MQLAAGEDAAGRHVDPVDPDVVVRQAELPRQRLGQSDHARRDRLGDGVVTPGAQMAFRPAGNATRYDFRVVWANGENAEMRNVDICSTSQIVATQRGIEAR